MNLTFVHDGYLAVTALESSFQLFVFDGYLIYGVVPPPPPTTDVDGVKQAPERSDEDAQKKYILQDNEDWMFIFKAFLQCQN